MENPLFVVAVEEGGAELFCPYVPIKCVYCEFITSQLWWLYPPITYDSCKRDTHCIALPVTVHHFGAVRPDNHKFPLNSASYATNNNVLNYFKPIVALVDVGYESSARWRFANLATLNLFRDSRV